MADKFDYLIQWWNLIYILPAIGSLIHLGLLAFGIASAESDMDADIDTDVDMDADIDTDVDMDEEIETDITRDANFTLKALSVFGVGRVPLSILLISFGLIWGFIGSFVNFYLRKVLVFPGFFIGISIVLTLVISLFLVRYISIGLNKILPTSESYSVAKKDFVGKTAEVRFKITENSGTATLRDKYQNLREIECRTKEGVIEKDSKIILVSYDEKNDLFIVELNPLELKEA